MNPFDQIARRIMKTPVLLGYVFLVFGSPACEKPPPNPPPEYLVKVNESVLTIEAYNRSLEIAKTAYPYETFNDPEDDIYKSVQIKVLRINVLKQLTERLILQERAKELDITVSEEEIQKEVDAIKSLYPDDTFEQSLLEAAISYSAWENELRARILMEKLIETEVADKITITMEEMAQYYEENLKDESIGEKEKSKMDRLIVKRLKQKKTEEAYQAWIDELKNRYTISVNEKRWKQLTDS